MISVLIPAYNSERYAAASIDSVLAQDFTDWEIVIVVDGATDSTEEVVRAYEARDPRIKVHIQTNKGVCVTRNECLRLSRPDYPYLLFFDNDDILEPDALRVLYDLLTANPSAPAAAARCSTIDGDGNPLSGQGFYETWEHRRGIIDGRLQTYPEGAPLTFDQLSFHNYVTTPGVVLIRKEVAQALNGFDTNYIVAEDWDFFWRMTMKYGEIVTTTRSLLRYRKHQTNASRKTKVMQKGMYDFQRNLLHNPDLSPSQRIAARKAYLAHETVKSQYAGIELRRGNPKEALRLFLGMVKGIGRYVADSVTAPKSTPPSQSTEPAARAPKE